jgi:hypothetical protein
MSVNAEVGHATQWRVPAHRTYPAMRARAGSATQGPRGHAFGTVSSASGAGCARLHHRAPGAGVSIVQRQHSKAAGSADMMLHGM